MKIGIYKENHTFLPILYVAPMLFRLMGRNSKYQWEAKILIRVML